MIIKGINLSKLTLGTVQLGIPYGLKENYKVPTPEQAETTLDAALNAGIVSIDTASAYGDSESKIGSWLQKHPNQPVTITTKVHDIDHSDRKALIGSLIESTQQAKERLCVSTISVLMVHHFNEYIENKEAFDEAFRILKAQGDILASGVSAYSTDDYRRIAESGLDAVQIPINVLDWTQLSSGGISVFRDAGMIVFARSIYLQGLLLRTPDKLEPRMKFASDTLAQYIEACGRFNLKQNELAMSFVLSLREIESIVVGCRNAEQVISNIKTLQSCRLLSETEMNILKTLFFKTEKRVTNPMLWPK